jgi:predicted PurR-regulated permease PerM
MTQPWSKPTKRLAALALVGAALFGLYLARNILTPFVVGALLALVLSPAVKFFHGRCRMPHGLAVATTYLLLLGVAAAVLIVVIPALVRSAAALDLTAIADQITAWALETLRSLRTLEVLGGRVDLSATIDPLIEALEEEGGGFRFDFGTIAGSAWSFTSAVFTGVIGFLLSALLALVISVYLSASVDREARQNFYALLPASHVGELQILGQRIARVWNEYLRGQLTVAVLVGMLTTLIMFAVGMPGALIIGLLGGFLNIIPTLGPVFASIVAFVVALVQGSQRLDVSNLVFALIVVGAYAVIQQIESNVITPRVLAGAVDISPIAILLGILVGFSAFGVLGAVVAVPVVASAREVFRYVGAKLVDADPYPEGPPPPRVSLAQRWAAMRRRFNGKAPRPESST